MKRFVSGLTVVLVMAAGCGQPQQPPGAPPPGAPGAAPKSSVPRWLQPVVRFFVKPAPPMQMPPPEVAVVTVAPQPVVLTTELPGRTTPYRISEVRPQVSGLVEKRLFEEGSDVKEGQALYRLDAAPFRAALANAQAALARAEANLPAMQARAKRAQELFAGKAISQQELDDATAALKGAEAEVQAGRANVTTAQIQLGYTEITASIAGRIGKSSVTDGAIVTAYQMTPLTTIQQLDPIYVDVPQSTVALLQLQRRLSAGRLTRDVNEINKVQLILEDGTQYPQEGTLQFRDVSVDPATATVTVRMMFPNPNGVLLPGMFVRAVVKEGVNENAILVPQQAVTRDAKGTPMAMVVGADNKVALRILTTERAVGDKWLVTSGLQAGDRVITEGLQKIFPGVPVRIAPPAGPSAPGAPTLAPTGPATK